MAHRSRLPEDADPVPAYALEAAPAPSFLPQAAPPAYAEASSAGKQHEQNGLTAGWRVPPFYLTSIDRADHKEATTALYMRLPTDAQADQRASTSSSSSLEACKCSERGDCTCNRRGVVAFTAELGLRDNDFAPKGEIVIVRGTNKADIVARLKRGTLRHRSRWTVLDPQGKHWAYVERHGVETTVRPPEDNVSLRWVRESGTFTLTASPDSVLLGKHLPDGVLCLENVSSPASPPQRSITYALDARNCRLRRGCLNPWHATLTIALSTRTSLALHSDV